MAITKKPGQSTGNNGGIYQQVGPRGGKQPNYSTVPDNRRCRRRPSRATCGPRSR